MQRAGRVMSEHGGGVIVNIGANRSHGQAQRSAYLASKEGLLSLTREAARELAAVQIRVHGVCPGKINAEVAESFHKQMGGGALADQKIPESVTELVLFLCSQQAAHLTGIIIDCVSD
jgi:3-oxoacyl-[acyl-carrier protein] reductase